MSQIVFSIVIYSYRNVILTTAICIGGEYLALRLWPHTVLMLAIPHFQHSDVLLSAYGTKETTWSRMETIN